MLVFTEPTRSGRPAGRSLPQAAASACDLDRVAERRAGAVRLDVVDLGRRDAARRASARADHRLLRAAVRAR